MTDRQASIERKTKETNIEVTLNLDGGNSSIETGIPFFTHMLEQLAKHSGMGLLVKSIGDLEVDAHHTVEDVGISIGEAFNNSLGEKLGIRRFSSVSVPLDEALIDVALDISGRAYCNYEIDFPGEKILGEPPFDPQLMEEFWRAFVAAAKVTLHISMVRGKNTHHIVEATFKGVARALRDAVKIESSDLPSTKGSL